MDNINHNEAFTTRKKILFRKVFRSKLNGIHEDDRQFFFLVYSINKKASIKLFFSFAIENIQGKHYINDYNDWMWGIHKKILRADEMWTGKLEMKNPIFFIRTMKLPKKYKEILWYYILIELFVCAVRAVHVRNVKRA